MQTQHQIALYEPLAAGDASPAEFARQLRRCEDCPHRVRGRCRLSARQAGTSRRPCTLIARKDNLTCPLDRPKQPPATALPAACLPARQGRQGYSSQATTSADTPTLETDRIAREVTIGFTAMNRPHLVRRLYDSIRRHYPKIRIVVADNGDKPADLPEDGRLAYLMCEFDCGISAARNAIVDRLDTPYLWLLDDDLVFTTETDVTRLLDVLDHDSRVGGAGGTVWDYRPNNPVRLVNWAQNLEVVSTNRGRVIRGSQTGEPLERTAGGVWYQRADTCHNFALFRTDLLRAHPWPDEFKVQEHLPFCWRLKQLRGPRLAVVDSVRCQHRREITPDYAPFRRRNAENFERFKQRENLSAIQVAGYDHTQTRQRPNLIVFGIGHSGTRVLAKMAHALGWHAADADELYGESVQLREINDRLLQGERAPDAEMEGYLARLPQPWAIKDPRLCLTLDRWRPLLARYSPALVWITRERSDVEESHRKRGRSPMRGDYGTIYAEVNAAYHDWRGPKLQIDFERLVDAAAIIDPERAAGQKPIDPREKRSSDR